MTPYDFRLYYHNSIFLYPLGSDGGLRPCYVRDTGGADSDGHVRASVYFVGRDKKRRTKTLGIDPEAIVTHGAAYGYVNTPYGVCVIERVPTRRARKGLFDGGLRLHGGIVMDLSTDTSCHAFWSLFNPAYTSLSEALERAQDQRISSALSRDFALRPTSPEGYNILYRECKVGHGVYGRDNKFVMHKGADYLDSELRRLLPELDIV